MAPSLTLEAALNLRTYIHNATRGDTHTLPGAILHIVDASNKPVFTHTSGGSIPLSSNTLTIVHSLTKLLGAVAYLQLIERGLASLDDPSLINDFLPELAAKSILTGFEEGQDNQEDPMFEERKNEITPRMLMNHTYGGGHTFFNSLLHEYLKAGWEERNEAADPHQTILDSPLLWQPGTHANYGQGFDWLAVLIERITGQDLNSYFKEHIFGPLELRGIGFEDAFGGDITSRPGNEGLFWPRSFEGPNGAFLPMDPPVLKRIEKPTAYPEGKYHTYPLGTGLVSSAADYARILTVFLNEGLDPVTNHRLLSEKSIKEITSPQLPEHLRNDSRMIPSAIPGVVLSRDLQKGDMDPEGSWGFGCGVQGADRVLEDGKRGRSKHSFYWYGAANMEFWADAEKGIVVVVNGNYYPWNDEKWTKFVAGVEGRIYEGLQ